MGVKSLWTLLTPVGRPVMLETVEGKSLAIDSSIWLYQFQATMRDKEGKALVNAHVLGFLRRIAKLLFYGIKPVFVFDGGAPVLKRNTLNERKRKKSGAALSHAKLAERLLAAQLRREAVNQAQNAKGSKEKGKGIMVLDENTVYLEDIDGSAPRTPAKRKNPPTPSSSTKKKNLQGDPYHLPQLDMEEVISKATSSTTPDPRLATEDELRSFIDQMRPENFDINSPAFRELPTEVQYEIIGDLRLKSRQTSYARLHKMLQNTRTPLDFSKQQIQNLRQRNALTQQLLITTDSIGSAHIAIPVRIASERNREYVLIKNESESGGWVLGIRDTGTREKPIVIDHEEDLPEVSEDDSDADMEEVPVPVAAPPDHDLREYQREMALSGVSARSPSKRALPSRPINRKTKSSSLFAPDTDDEENEEYNFVDDSDENEQLAYAIQASLDQMKSSTSPQGKSKLHAVSTPSRREISPEDDFYLDYTPSNRLQTALSIARAGPSRIQTTPKKGGFSFGKPSMLSSSIVRRSPSPAKAISDSDESMEEVISYQPIEGSHLERETSSPSPGVGSPGQDPVSAIHLDNPPDSFEATQPKVLPAAIGSKASSDVITSGASNPDGGQSSSIAAVSQNLDDEQVENISSNPSPPTSLIISAAELPQDIPSFGPARNLMISNITPSLPEEDKVPEEVNSLDDQNLSSHAQEEDNTKEIFYAWSRTPSPSRELQSVPSSAAAEGWDAAEEIDVQAEEGEFARFLSQVKGKDMDDVRKEIDEEIRVLNQQNKIALRDSEDITQQMIAQIMTMLRLFGIPYITAPMEAEAQCAELVNLNLVDGVITDDSDVFLFGAQRVYKNMFNQSKTVECFLSSDLLRELGLDRDTLIRLAYLLGSDYTEGLSGVGPVVAMELLKEFPGRGGLHKFREWWTKVQSGKDTELDNQSKFRKQFKRKFKNLYLAGDWPNSVVLDAYHHPTVDRSEEPFKWGMPDLDGLRLFLQQELGWSKSKVDELILPIIQKMNKRNEANALNRQGNLNDFLDISAGSGTHAPRHRNAYTSKRLQEVLKDFRNKQKSGSSGSPTTTSRSRSRATQVDDNLSESGSNNEEPPTKRQKKQAKGGTAGKKMKAAPKPSAGAKATVSKRGTGRGRKARLATRRRDSVTTSDGDDGEGDEFVPDVIDDNTIRREAQLNLRPRPKPRLVSKAAKHGLSTEIAETGSENVASNP